MPVPANVQHMFDWLVDGAQGAPTPLHTITRLGIDFNAAGVPVDRMEAFVRTLHPHIVGRSFLWVPGKDTVARENTYAYLHSAEFMQSPVSRVFETGKEIRRRLTGPAISEFVGLQELGKEGYTDYIAAPLIFMGGTVHAVVFATKHAAGFDDAHLEAIRAIVRPLSRVGETFALMRTAVNLLNTYVGRDAGERILQGRIQRGDTENIRCVIWFSDLRGFTSLSATRTPSEIIAVLNRVFDCQVPAIERHRGEVLKFMGDGMLAIFPVDERRPPLVACEAAAAAAKEAFEALSALNALQAQGGAAPLRFGVALHVGDVAFGNIGGMGRLDFTCIGPAVNLASRIEGLTGKLSKRVLLSAAFAETTKLRTRSVGTFELKGVDEPQNVYELDEASDVLAGA